jgi:hypothetical protein
VKELLPESAEGDLANVCSWPDEIRFHYHWSSALHYVDTPDFRCNYEYFSKFGLPLLFFGSAKYCLHYYVNSMVVFLLSCIHDFPLCWGIETNISPFNVLQLSFRGLS